MPSSALLSWTSARAKRLDELVAAHKALSGAARGRRWQTKSLNWSLTLRLAAEFQGFTRDLHEQCIDVILAPMGNLAQADVVRNTFTFKRGLDSGNAQPGNLGTDFSRLGLALWPNLTSRYPDTKLWNDALTLLNDARNALAHSDDVKLGIAKQKGYDAGTIAAFHGCRIKLNRLANAMDDVTADYLQTFLSLPQRPW